MRMTSSEGADRDRCLVFGVLLRSTPATLTWIRHQPTARHRIGWITSTAWMRWIGTVVRNSVGPWRTRMISGDPWKVHPRSKAARVCATDADHHGPSTGQNAIGAGDRGDDQGGNRDPRGGGKAVLGVIAVAQPDPPLGIAATIASGTAAPWLSRRRLPARTRRPARQGCVPARQFTPDAWATRSVR